MYPISSCLEVSMTGWMGEGGESSCDIPYPGGVLVHQPASPQKQNIGFWPMNRQVQQGKLLLLHPTITQTHPTFSFSTEILGLNYCLQYCQTENKNMEIKTHELLKMHPS